MEEAGQVKFTLSELYSCTNNIESGVIPAGILETHAQAGATDRGGDASTSECELLGCQAFVEHSKVTYAA